MELEPVDLKARRLKAYELFIGGDGAGNRLSLRAIAQRLGVTPQAVSSWKKVDNWEQRLAVAQGIIEAGVSATRNSFQALVRAALFKHIESLSKSIDKMEDGFTKAKCVLAFVKVCRELKQIDPSLLEVQLDQSSVPLTFKDDIDATATPPTPEVLMGQSGELSVDIVEAIQDGTI